MMSGPRACLVACCLLPGLLAQEAPPRPKESDIPTFGTTVVIPSGLRGEIYELAPGSFRLPKFEKHKPIGAIYTTSLNVTPRDFQLGFPGITNRFEWFAIDYKGKFWVQKPGRYRFFLESDDGSRLYIDDKLVIDNDGVHAPWTTSGGLELTAGVHTIRVSYFQGPRYAVALVLAVQRPGGGWRVFNTDEFKPPPEEDSPALAILNAVPRRHDFDFRLAALRFRNDAAGCQNAVVIEVAGKNVEAAPDPAREISRVHLSLLTLVEDEEGKVVDRYSLDAPYDIPNAKVPEVLANPITYSHPVELPPGRYTVEAALIDHEGRRASADEIEVVSPQPRSGIFLSNVTLVQRVEPAGKAADPSDPLVYQGQRIVPLLAQKLTPDMKPLVYFVVYPDTSSAEKPEVQVEFLVNGHSLAKQTSGLPAPDASGAIPVLVAAALGKGDCELRITAIQGGKSATESVHYALAGD
jgi:hypothetical protein